VKQGDKVEEQKGKKYKQSAKEGKAQVRSVQCKGCTEQGKPELLGEDGGMLNLYRCAGCNTSMCLCCGSMNVTQAHFFGQGGQPSECGSRTCPVWSEAEKFTGSETIQTKGGVQGPGCENNCGDGDVQAVNLQESRSARSVKEGEGSKEGGQGWN